MHVREGEFVCLIGLGSEIGCCLIEVSLVELEAACRQGNDFDLDVRKIP